MADGSSLPYLGNITITPRLPSDGIKVYVTITWTVQAIRPDKVQLYALFGSSAANLLDLGQLFDTVAANISSATIPLPATNRNPFLYIGVAPRNYENGVPTDSMVDASGEPQGWDNFVTQQGLNITYTNPPPPTLPPPNIQAQSFVKTLTANDYLSVTVSGANSDNYNLIVNTDGTDNAQQNSSNGNYPPIPSVPGKAYALRAEQHIKGYGWSPFSTPITVIANPRVRSLRTFLSISGVLHPGTRVRQYAAANRNSTGIMMGLRP
jgi:hypothetical protein